MKPIDRRSFLKTTLLTASAVSFPGQQPLAAQTAPRLAQGVSNSQAPGIIDTNINLFSWPFRALKYRDTKTLVAKLKKHRVIEAWAGSFEALFSKDISGVNSRLASECQEHGPGFLIPFGGINLAWPDWQDDVRRCHEVHKMPGIRIYPGYQPFDLDHPGMGSLVKMTSERDLVLQVVFGMEDPRVHHPIINVATPALAPLLKAVKSTPTAKVELLHFSGSIRPSELSQFLSQTNTVMDISRLEGNGAVSRTIGSARVPVERIVFGSHAPYFPLETAILKLIESPLDAQQLQAIMHGNARRLLPRA